MAEIDGAIHNLNSNREFKQFKTTLPADDLKHWDAAVTAFTGMHKPLKQWRNGVGGHFHHAAARHAVDTIWETTEGAVELYRTSKNSFDIRMPFAYELLTVAMTRNKGQRTEREFLVESLTFLFNAFTAAREAVTVLAMNWLLKKFR